MVGVATTGTPADQLAQLVQRLDWVRDENHILLRRFPDIERLSSAGAGTAAGCVNDSDFNGYVYSCTSPEGLGFVIALPMGALQLVSNAAGMLTLLSDLDLSEMLGSAFAEELLGKREPWLLRQVRRIAYKLRRGYLQRRYARQISWQYAMMIERYVRLGTFDTPDLIAELGILPLFVSVRRWGHPLEAGGNLRLFATRFLLLHEYGHVAAGHLSDEMPTEPLPSHFDREFVADEFAFHQLIGSATSDNTAVAGALGAWLVLTLAARIEELSGSSSSSHPPASIRLGRLRTYLLSGASQRSAMKLALEMVDAMTKHEGELFESAKALEVLSEESALARLLRASVEEHPPKTFYDQLPRWLLFGAPLRLCRELAELRAEFERRIAVDGQDRAAAVQLKQVMWVFEAALSAPSNFFSKRLEGFYHKALEG
jgi:hypothetical protein